MMLHIKMKYQGSRPCGFSQEVMLYTVLNIEVLVLAVLVKTCACV